MLAAVVAGGTGNAVASFTADAAAASGFAASTGALLLTAGSVVAIVVRVGSGTSVDRGGGTGMAQMVVVPAIAGAVADRTSYAVVFGGMSVTMLVALGALVVSGALGRRRE